MDKLYIDALRPHVTAVMATLAQSVRPTDKKTLVLLHILNDRWETDTKLTQRQLAEAIPNSGHHELWEARLGNNTQTTLRLVRKLVEKEMRKKHLLPVLSTPGKAKRRKNTAGYWLARAKSESVEYCERHRAEIGKTYRSALKTLAAVKKVCRVGEVRDM